MEDRKAKYRVYKDATHKFLQWLTGGSYDKNINLGKLENALLNCLESNIGKVNWVPREIHKALGTAIRFRKVVQKVFYKYKQDRGHTYFIKFLDNCLSKLLPFVNAKEKKMEEKKEEEENSFYELFRDYDYTETSDIPEETHIGEYVKKTQDELTYDVQKDIEFTMTVLFLLEMDSMMQKVVNAWSDYRDGNISITTATAVTNTAIRLCEVITSSLQLDYSHIKDYRYVEVIVEFGDCVEHIMCSYGFSYHDALEIVVIAKNGAHLPRLYKAAIETIMRRYKISEQVGCTILLLLVSKLSTLNSSPLHPEDRKLALDKTLTWSNVIGNKNGIFQTCNFLRDIAEIITPKHLPVAKEGFFGMPYNENSSNFTSVSDLMDFYGSDLIPHFVGRIKLKNLSSDFYMDHELNVFALENHFKKYNDNKVITMTLAFGVHATALALITAKKYESIKVDLKERRELIGKRFAFEYCKRNDDHFAKEMKRIFKIPERTEDLLLDSYITIGNIRTTLAHICVEKNFLTESEVGGEVSVPVKVGRIERAIYNPVLGGQLTCMLGLMYNFELGLTYFDSISQARVTLHFYNALCHVGYITEKIPIFDKMITELGNKTKMLWVGSKPSQKGEFLKGFLLAFGYSPQAANKLPVFHHGRIEFDKTRLLKCTGNLDRDLHAADPDILSPTYKIICENNYSDFPENTLNDSNLFLDHVKTVVEKEIKEANLETGTLLTMDFFTINQTFHGIWKGLTKVDGVQGVIDNLQQDLKLKENTPGPSKGKSRKNAPKKLVPVRKKQALKREKAKRQQNTMNNRIDVSKYDFNAVCTSTKSSQNAIRDWKESKENTQVVSDLWGFFSLLGLCDIEDDKLNESDKERLRATSLVIISKAEELSQKHQYFQL